MRPLLLGRAVAALAMVLAISLGAGGGARAAEPFAGQRELLQQRLSTPAGQALPLASALVVGRLGEGEPELLLLGTPAHGGAPLARDARFELGSVTKALVGSLLAKMAAQGRLGLDDPVGRWVPELNGTPAGGLTLRSLATHHSGLPRVPMSVAFLWSGMRDPRDPYRHYSVADLLSDLRAWTPPAQTEFAYSNLGFALLGLALERAATQPLAHLMASEILQPAGASGAGLEAELATGQIQGYDASGRATPAWNLGAFAGAGALRANAPQMLALLEAARLGRAPFDAGAQLEQARRHATGSVGLGWMRTEKHGDRIVWHNGGTGGFRSFFGYSELSGRAVMLMANGTLDLDGLGLHLINPAFDPRPMDDPAQGAASVVAAGAALGAIAVLAWRAWRPRSRFEAALDLSLAVASLALAWRWLPTTDPVTLGAVLGLALLAAGLMLWRGRSQPVWPARRRALLVACLNAAVGAGVVMWAW
jgi:CubicO group peptidase (beta-lactamase class C family)